MRQIEQKSIERSIRAKQCRDAKSLYDDDYNRITSIMEEWNYGKFTDNQSYILTSRIREKNKDIIEIKYRQRDSKKSSMRKYKQGKMNVILSSDNNKQINEFFLLTSILSLLTENLRLNLEFHSKNASKSWYTHNDALHNSAMLDDLRRYSQYLQLYIRQVQNIISSKDIDSRSITQYIYILKNIDQELGKYIRLGLNFIVSPDLVDKIVEIERNLSIMKNDIRTILFDTTYAVLSTSSEQSTTSNMIDVEQNREGVKEEDVDQYGVVPYIFGQSTILLPDIDRKIFLENRSNDIDLHIHNADKKRIYHFRINPILSKVENTVYLTSNICEILTDIMIDIYKEGKTKLEYYYDLWIIMKKSMDKLIHNFNRCQRLNNQDLKNEFDNINQLFSTIDATVYDRSNESIDQNVVVELNSQLKRFNNRYTNILNNLYSSSLTYMNSISISDNAVEERIHEGETRSDHRGSNSENVSINENPSFTHRLLTFLFTIRTSIVHFFEHLFLYIRSIFT